MENHASPPVDTDLALVTAAVARHKANKVAAALDLSRSTLLSWMTGSARPGTDILIRSRLPLLVGLAPKT